MVNAWRYDTQYKWHLVYMTLSITKLCHYAECHIDLLLCWVSQWFIIMLSVTFINYFAERHYAECQYVNCHFAECQYAENHIFFWISLYWVPICCHIYLVLCWVPICSHIYLVLCRMSLCWTSSCGVSIRWVSHLLIIMLNVIMLMSLCWECRGAQWSG